jgi:hypothetical protein
MIDFGALSLQQGRRGIHYGMQARGQQWQWPGE